MNITETKAPQPDQSLLKKGEKHSQSTMENLQNVLQFGKLYESENYFSLISKDLTAFQTETRTFKFGDEELNDYLRSALSEQQQNQTSFMNLIIQGLRDKHSRLRSQWSAASYKKFLDTEHRTSWEKIANVLHVFSVLTFLSALGQTFYLWVHKKHKIPSTLRWLAKIKDEDHLRFWHAEAVMELMTEHAFKFREMAIWFAALAEYEIDPSLQSFGNIEPAETPNILTQFSLRLHGRDAVKSMAEAMRSLSGAHAHVENENIRYLAMFRVVQLLGERPNVLSFPGMKIQNVSDRRFYQYLRSLRHKLSHICTREALALCGFLVKQKQTERQKNQEEKSAKISIASLLEEDCREIQNYLQNLSVKWTELDKEGWRAYYEKFKDCTDYDTAGSTPSCSSRSASEAESDGSSLASTKKSCMGDGIRKLRAQIESTSGKRENDISTAMTQLKTSQSKCFAARARQRGPALKPDEEHVVPSSADLPSASPEAEAKTKESLKIMRVQREINAWENVIKYLAENDHQEDIAEYLQEESRGDFIALVAESFEILESVTRDIYLPSIESTTLNTLAAQYAAGLLGETWALRNEEAIEHFKSLSKYFTQVRNALFHSITLEETLPIEHFKALSEYFTKVSNALFHCSDDAAEELKGETVAKEHEPSSMRVIRMISKLAGCWKATMPTTMEVDK